MQEQHSADLRSPSTHSITRQMLAEGRAWCDGCSTWSMPDAHQECSTCGSHRVRKEFSSYEDDSKTSSFDAHKVDTSVAEAFGEYCEVVSRENYDALLRLYEELLSASKAIVDYWELGGYEPGIESRLTKAVRGE